MAGRAGAGRLPSDRLGDRIRGSRVPTSITTANERPPEGGKEFAFLLNQPLVNYVVPALDKSYPYNGRLRYKNV